MQQELFVVYTYFSHHIRNFTAIITATVPMIDDNLSVGKACYALVYEIEDAAFLLDLFDAGMGICFVHCLNNRRTVATDEPIDMKLALLQFMNRCEKMMRERGVSFELALDNDGLGEYASRYDIRILSCVILYEAMLQAKNKLTVHIANTTVKIISDGGYNPPAIWEIFKKILKDSNITFTYGIDYISLEY